MRAARKATLVGGSSRDARTKRSSNIVSLPKARRREPCAGDEATMPSRSMRRGIPRSSHVTEFVRQCLEPASGTSIGASELRATYEAWCADHDYEPLSQQKLGVDLMGLGFAKWKSRGLIRYRDLQLGGLNALVTDCSALEAELRRCESSRRI
jgi:hypothetical protein